MQKSKQAWPFHIASFTLLVTFVSTALGQVVEEQKEECYIQDTLCIPIAPKRTDYNKDELLLLMGKGVPVALYQSLLKKYGLNELSEVSIDSLGIDMKIADTKGQDPLELSKKINFLYNELEAATNNSYQLEAIPSGLLNKDDYPKSLTGAREALKLSKGEGVLIGMVDGAVDTRHSAFKGRIEQVSLVESDGKSVASLLHGTAVAGVLISSSPQIGIAPQAKVFSVVAFEQNKSTTFSSSSSLIAQAIDRAISEKVDVLNLSFSSNHDPLVEKMVKKAIAKGIIVVASCGNDSSKKRRYPAAIPGVVAVTAVDHLKKFYKKANTGAYIDVAAPGVGVLTTGPGERHQLSTGTSIAAANVSGSLALLLAKKKNIDPDTLSYTALDLGEPGRDNAYGDGLINVLRALRSID